MSNPEDRFTDILELFTDATYSYSTPEYSDVSEEEHVREPVVVGWFKVKNTAHVWRRTTGKWFAPLHGLDAKDERATPVLAPEGTRRCGYCAELLCEIGGNACVELDQNLLMVGVR